MSPPAPSSAPTGLGVLTEWRPDYVMILVVALIATGHLRDRRAARRQHIAWARRREVVFWIGLVALVWATNGFPQARSFQLMWVWISQELLLLLIVPIIVLAGQPLSLVSAVRGPDNLPARVLRTRALSFLGSPLVSPALVPVLCMALVFGGLGAFAVSSVWAGGVVHLVLFLAGALIALPLVNSDDQRSSLAVGLSLAVGFVELILDAFPGIALRFQTHLTLVHFAADRPAFSRDAIGDQHVAGGILWVVAEVLDLPFLFLAASRWIKADARDAARIDAELDARQHWAPDGDPVQAPTVDRPWWLDDPNLQDRFRRPS